MLDIIELESDLHAVNSGNKDEYLYRKVLCNIKSLDVTDLSEERELIAELFYQTLRAIQSIENVENAEKFHDDIIEAFENIKLIGKTNQSCNCLAIIDFLNELNLKMNNQTYNIELECKKLHILIRDLEPIKFIFKIRDDSDRRYFPINNLLGNIISDSEFFTNKIETYHIYIIQLALELFENISQDIKLKLKELVNNYNLKFINYLDSSCKRIDTKDMMNFTNNQVMVFYNGLEKKILIRHVKKEYFLDNNHQFKIESEKNTQNMEIAYFIELDIDGTPINYSTAIKESPMEFLKLVYEGNYRNIFIDDMIVKKTNGNFEPLNPFCKKDDWIIKKSDTKYESGEKYPKHSFLDVIKEMRYFLFSIDKNRNEMDQISFGLCIYLLEQKCIKIDDLFKKADYDDWAQNIIISNWVQNNANKVEAIELILKKYLQDLDYCKDYPGDEFKTNLFNISNFIDCLPYNFNLDWIYSTLNMPKTPSLYIGTVFEDKNGEYLIDICSRQNKTLAKIENEEVKNFSQKDVLFYEHEDVSDFFGNELNRYFVKDGDKWYSSAELQNVYKLIIQVEFKNNNTIKRDMNVKIHNIAFNELKKIFDLHRKELCDISIKKIDYNSLIKIRLLNNLVLNKIDNTNFEYYFNIFYKQQKLEFSQVIKVPYFSDEKDGVLVVPKDSIQEDSVLRKVYETYVRKDAVRDTDWWFSVNKLNKIENCFHINGKKIDTIRFLFDNTERGTATIRVLAMYLGFEQFWIKFKENKYKSHSNIANIDRYIESQKQKCNKYKCGESIVEVSEIFKCNNPKIEVCIFYGTSEGIELIEEFLRFCGFKDDQVQIYCANVINANASDINEECKNLKIEYKDIYIVIREFNMPKKYLLPLGAVGNADCIYTLLVQKKER